jgi:hypothetical protein
MRINELAIQNAEKEKADEEEKKGNPAFAFKILNMCHVCKM